MSRIPPHMKPAKVKHLLGQYGAITRIFLAQSGAAVKRKSVGAKGSGKPNKTFKEGWIEFEDKKIAKRVAESLNNRSIGGKKRSFYREDIWNLKYLKHFLWEHLTEKVANDRRVREQRVRLETMQAKRENSQYLDMVDKQKAFAAMEARKGTSKPTVRAFKQETPFQNGKLAQHVLQNVFSEGASKSR